MNDTLTVSKRYESGNVINVNMCFLSRGCFQGLYFRKYQKAKIIKGL